MRWTWLPVLLVAGCAQPSENGNLRATLRADFGEGTVELACTESSSGTCHVLIVAGDRTLRLSAAAGEKAREEGVGDGAQYCIGTAEPRSGCKLQPLRDGEQIYRATSVHKS